jgi:hypothetical protein
VLDQASKDEIDDAAPTLHSVRTVVLQIPILELVCPLLLTWKNLYH